MYTVSFGSSTPGMNWKAVGEVAEDPSVEAVDENAHQY
jgi:hypothetical protein